MPIQISGNPNMKFTLVSEPIAPEIDGALQLLLSFYRAPAYANIISKILREAAGRPLEAKTPLNVHELINSIFFPSPGAIQELSQQQLDDVSRDSRMGNPDGSGESLSRTSTDADTSKFMRPQSRNGFPSGNLFERDARASFTTERSETAPPQRKCEHSRSLGCNPHLQNAFASAFVALFQIEVEDRHTMRQHLPGSMSMERQEQ